VGPPTTELLPESGTEITAPPIVDDASLPSLPSLERVDTTEHSQVAEGARAAVVSAPRGPPHNPKNHHQDGPLRIRK